ncbi:MAG TPA: hypothetical protein VF576_11745, partial [Rubricoccaceae bacterium]
MSQTALPSPTSSVPSRIDPDHETTKRSSAELRALLDARQNDLQFRIQALKEELTNPSTVMVGGRPLPDVLRHNAWRYAGLAGTGGLAVGVVLGILAHRKRRPAPEEGLDLVRARLSSFLDDAAEHVRRGASSDEAVRRTLRHTPVVYAPPAEQAKSQARSSIREAVDMAVKSAVGFALKTAMDRVTKKLTGREETFAAI